MGHKKKNFLSPKHIKKNLTLALGFVGLGILMVAILPIWIWILAAGLVLIVFAIDRL